MIILNEHEKKMHALLDLPIFEDICQLEEYLEFTVKFHYNFRYVDTYQCHRNILFHGKHFLGMDYSMESCYLHRYINSDHKYDEHQSKHNFTYLQFLTNLQQIYAIEKKFQNFNFSFEDIFCVYLEYDCLNRFVKLFLMLQWGTNPVLGNLVKTYLNTWKKNIRTGSLDTQDIEFFKYKALSHLNYLTVEYSTYLGLENKELLLNWFEFFADSSFLPIYLHIINFIQKYKNIDKRTISQMCIFYPKYKSIFDYSQQNLKNTIPNLFKEDAPNRNVYWTASTLVSIYQTILELEHLLQMPKYKRLLALDRKLSFYLSRTCQFSHQIKWTKMLRIMLRASIYGGALFGGFAWYQKSASAMISEPHIVRSMSSKDLPTLGTIGTYSELQRAQRNAKNAISSSYQRSHNLPMKSWKVMEIPKTSTPVILLDPPRHEDLDTKREKSIKNKTVFSDKYLHKLIEEGYIAANTVWTAKGLEILNQYNLSCDTRLILNETSDRLNRRLLENFKSLESLEVKLLEDVRQTLEIPVNQTGRWLITRKVIATTDLWNKDLKSMKLHEQLAKYQSLNVNSTYGCWQKVSQKALDLATLYSSTPDILDTRNRQYCQEDITRCVCHIGDILNQHDGVELQTDIQNTVRQIAVNMNRSLPDTEYTQLVRQNGLQNPHCTMASSLRSLIGQLGSVRRSPTA